MKSNKISASLSWHCYKSGKSFGYCSLVTISRSVLLRTELTVTSSASSEKGILVQTSNLM